MKVFIDNELIKLVKDGEFQDKNQVMIASMIITKLDQLVAAIDQLRPNLVTKKDEIKNLMQKETAILS